MIRKLFIFFFIVPALLKAQEGVRPLGGNIGIVYKDLKPATKQQANNSQKKATSLSIPFRDDFWYAYKQSYPDQSLWQDSSTYVNTGHAIAPLSTGVATFDGLNKHGYPYTPNLQNMSSSLSADTLRSQPINLFNLGSHQFQPTDSLALSFHYQARGNGDSPEASDSLVVDFFMPNQNSWSLVWSQKGNSGPNVNDTMFKKAWIYITDTAFLQDNFMFRIRNKATTAGDFDHWHVDYVYLDQQRHVISDSSYDDISFGYIPTPFLKNYSSMPWEQYTQVEKATYHSVFIRNNSADSANNTNMTYEKIMYDNLGAQTFSYTGGAISNLLPFKRWGWDKFPAHSAPSFTYNFAPFSDSAQFTIKHYIFEGGPNAADDIRQNDTVVQIQKFGNYYSFDDGSAEGGYYINGTGGKMAVKIGVNSVDTLRALRIYFDPVGSMSILQNTLGLAQSSYNFRIIVWTDGGSGPLYLLLRDSSQNVMFYNGGGFNLSQEYKLTTPLVLSPGNYYIGIQQYVASGITVGFDKNLDHHESLYFDSGSGWTQSSIYGSLMMRPIFGAKIIPAVGIKENSSLPNDVAFVYPNPASEKITIELKKEIKSSYRLMNSLGQTIKEDQLNGTINEINTRELSAGVYFIIISSGANVQSKKIIVQH
ncbi:MAG: T9SS type A sorting domain-containing protein [Bacteroidia bacterium]